MPIIGRHEGVLGDSLSVDNSGGNGTDLLGPEENVYRHCSEGIVLATLIGRRGEPDGNVTGIGGAHCPAISGSNG